MANLDLKKIAVVIPTGGRSSLLEACLKSLIRSRCEKIQIEFFLGVRGHDDASAKVISETLGASSKVFHVQECPENLSAAVLRNRILDVVKGFDWVLFLDDDVLLPEFYFEVLEKVFTNHESVDVIGGPNLTPPNSSVFQQTAGAVLESRLATFVSNPRYRPEGKTRFGGEESFILCNLLVRRDLLKADSFLETLECAEETWLIQNLNEDHQKMLYVPQLFVWHERRPNWSSFARQVFKYGFGRGQLLGWGFWRITLAHLVPVVCVLYTLGVFLGLGTFGLLPPAFFLPFIFYLALLLIATLRLDRKDRSISLGRAFFLFPLIHISYALGFIFGVGRGSR